MKEYLPWAILALVAYTFVPPLMNVATTEIPSNIAVLITNGIFFVMIVSIVLYTNEPVMIYLTQPKALYAYGAGFALAVGIIAYYRALALGPVSVVTPIFGMFLVTSSVIGIVFLGDSLSRGKIVGIGFAILAVYFITAY